MTEKINKENAPIQVQYQVLTWGPCVVKLRMTDDFHQLLISEADASVKEENLYQHRLAGIIQKEYKFRNLHTLQPYINDILKIYDKVWKQWRNDDDKDKPPNKYLIRNIWVNYQKAGEFNPPHDHADDLSFVAYLKIPSEIEEEFKKFRGKSCGPGGISFLYGEGNRQAITYQAHFPKEKDLFIFPAWLKHFVAPFKADVERISVSGNISSHIPVNALEPVQNATPSKS